MKKICILLSLITMLICSGCGPTYKPLLEGTFYSESFSFQNEDKKEIFNQARITIKEITKEEYEEANGVNVFIDGYTSQVEEKRYLSIEFYLYSVETEQYELVTLFDSYYIEGTQQVFHCKAYLKINDDEYQDEKRDTILLLDEVGPFHVTIFGKSIDFR